MGYQDAGAFQMEVRFDRKQEECEERSWGTDASQEDILLCPRLAIDAAS